MRRLLLAFRRTFLAVAVAQCASGALLSVADGLVRTGEGVLASHAEDFGRSHNTRAHADDCVACRELRVGYVPPPNPPGVVAPELGGSATEGDLSVAPFAPYRVAFARGPPSRIG
jgi:hypothetical protein